MVVMEVVSSLMDSKHKTGTIKTINLMVPLMVKTICMFNNNNNNKITKGSNNKLMVRILFSNSKISLVCKDIRILI